jgi:predicted nucleic acid-binding protein
VTRRVLDASIVVKWYVEEVYSPSARRLLESDDELLGPDLLLMEVGNAFLKKLRLGEMRREIAEQALLDIPEIVRLTSVNELTWRALTFALEHGRSIYDSYYVVLAMRESCALVTADERLYNALRGRLPGVLVWIDEMQ